MSTMQGLSVAFIRFMQLCALVALLTGMGVIAFQSKYCVLDADIGWHLKVGDWIIDHLAVPHTGILSRTAANRPWVAYSWGYELMLSRAYATRIGRTASRRLFQPRPSPTIRLSAGQPAQPLSQGQMTYHLRRFRLHGIIERIPQTHRYRITHPGLRTLWLCTPV